MSIEQDDQRIDVEGLWRQYQIQQIRDRSIVPFSELRRREFLKSS